MRRLNTNGCCFVDLHLILVKKKNSVFCVVHFALQDHNLVGKMRFRQIDPLKTRFR